MVEVNNDALKHAEEARKQAEEAKRVAEKLTREHQRMVDANAASLKDGINSAVGVREDKENGKSYWLWFELDNKTANMVRALQAFVTPKINEFGAPKVGKLLEDGAVLIGKPQMAKAANVVGQSAFLWSTVFFQQVADMVSHTGDYRQQTGKLYKQFKPIIEASGVNVDQNEVMQTEFQRARSTFSRSVQNMAGDAVTLLPNVMIATQQQRELLNKQPLKIGWLGGKKNAAPDAGASAAQALEEKKVRVQAAIKQEMDLYHHDLAPDSPEYRQALREVASDVRHKMGEFSRPVDSPKAAEDSMSNWLMWGSMASPIVNSIIRDDGGDSSITAWSMIQSLRSEVEAVCYNKEGGCEFAAPDPHRIFVAGKNLPSYIVSIVQQNELNRNRTEIGGVNLERLQTASEQIADALSKGIIDTNALVVLVGEHKIIQRNGTEVHVASESKIKAEIEALSKRMGRKSEITEEEFYKAFTNPQAIAKEVKDNLSAMQGMEKACFMALLPDEVLKKAGESEKSIREARSQAVDHLYPIVDRYMHQLAKATENVTPEELHQLGMTKKNLKDLRHFISAMDDEDKMEALDSVIKGHRGDMLSLMATVMLNQQHENPAEMRRDWSSLVNSKSAGKGSFVEAVAPEQSAPLQVEEPAAGGVHTDKVSRSAPIVPRDRMARAETSNNIGVGGV